MFRIGTLPIVVLGLVATFPAMAAASQPPVVETSTSADQQQMAVTVYNSNLALVRDTRRLELSQGTVELRFMDIAASVDPATVHIVSVTTPTDLNVLEQDYEYDLLNPQKLLDKFVGKQVTLVRTVPEGGAAREERVPAILLANNSGPVWKIGQEIVTGLKTDHYIFPDVPENLYSRPTLVWLIENHHAGPQIIEASYLAHEMKWNADYVLAVSAQETRGALSGWVTIVNRTGTTYPNAQLQLVAGEVHRAPRPLPRYEGVLGGVAGGVPQFVQEAISEYHLYTLARPTTLRNNETKQISLLSASGLHLEKQFRVYSRPEYFRSQLQPGMPLKDPVEVHLMFQNSAANTLGIPLPGGTVRVYQRDSKGRMQFVGEDGIAHTPKDEKVDLHTGNAFDVVEERRQTVFERLGQHNFETAFEITLRNHKPEPITVEVNEAIGGEWEMIESNYKYEKTSAFSARFKVPVGADAQAVLTYRVRARQ